jgi:hypothetical protein
MHFHLPKPLHGWRAFAGEVGIIVVGVLIALGAQQIAEIIHWRDELDDFRVALRAEASDDLGTYIYRAKLNPCIATRLDELQRWLDARRAGRSLKLSGPIGIPSSLVVRTNVWDSRDTGTIAHMPLDEKLDYGYLYTEFANNEVHRLDERAAFLELASFDGATELDHPDLMRLQGLITRARLRDFRMTDNARRFIRHAARMGLTPKMNPDWPEPEPEICRPILAAGGARGGQGHRAG